MKNYLTRSEVENELLNMKRAGRYFLFKEIVDKMESKPNGRYINYDELLRIYYQL